MGQLQAHPKEGEEGWGKAGRDLSASVRPATFSFGQGAIGSLGWTDLLNCTAMGSPAGRGPQDCDGKGEMARHSWGWRGV